MLHCINAGKGAFDDFGVIALAILDGRIGPREKFAAQPRDTVTPDIFIEIHGWDCRHLRNGRGEQRSLIVA